MSSTSTPSTSELIEGVLFYPIALVISATIFPGLILCIPGLILAAAFILIPLAAVAIVLLVVGAIIAAPIFAVRGIRELVRRRADSEEVGDPVPALAPTRFAAAAVQRLTADAPLHR
jgi:hypothetical protein